MKRVFVDANIVIDLLCERYPWFPKVLRIFSMSECAGDQCALSDVSSLSQWHLTEALGQLCQYAYLFCRDKIGKMVIVGASETNKEVEQYLSWFRQKHMMEVYYMQVSI